MQILILGMHRSGTSVVTRLVNMLGVYVGAEGTSTGANTENPKGFWERRDVRMLNDFVLNSMQCDWNRVSEYSVAGVPDEIQTAFRTQAAKIVLELDGHRPWVVKEPRICLLLALWRQVLEVPVCIHVHRDPLEVAASLQKRNGIPLVAGLALWEKYLRESVNASQGLKQVHVQHDDLMARPMESLQVLKESLAMMGVRGLSLPSREEVACFVDPALHHEHAEDIEGSRMAARFRELQARVIGGDVPDAALDEDSLSALEQYELSLGALPPEVVARSRNISSPLTSERIGKLEVDLANVTKRSSKNIDAMSGQLAALDGSIARIDEALSRTASLTAVQDMSAEVESFSRTIDKLDRKNRRKVSALGRLTMKEIKQAGERLSGGIGTVEDAIRRLAEQRQAEEVARSLERELLAAKAELNESRKESSALSIEIARLRERNEAMKSVGAESLERERRAREEIVELTKMLQKEENAHAALGARLESERSLHNQEEGKHRNARIMLEDRLADTSVRGAMMMGALGKARQEGVPDSFGARLKGALRVLRGGSHRVRQEKREEDDLHVLRTSALFDADWYLARNPDVAKSGVDPHWHYLVHGALEGRDPGPAFSTLGYCRANPDVTASGVNPLIHYEVFGRGEGRSMQVGGKA